MKLKKLRAKVQRRKGRHKRLSRLICVKRSRSGGWTREDHVTRTAARKTRDVNDKRNVEKISDAVNIIIKSDPKSYGDAMKSGQNTSGW